MLHEKKPVSRVREDRPERRRGRGGGSAGAGPRGTGERRTVDYEMAVSQRVEIGDGVIPRPRRDDPKLAVLIREHAGSPSTHRSPRAAGPPA